MSRTHAKILLGAAALAIIALVVGVSIWLSSGSKKPPLTHVAYARLFGQAVVKKTRIGVVDQWPKPPYQTFGDNFRDQCFQWFDRPTFVYTLCFKNGVLAFKTTS
jgi:hypothetical protein